MIRNLLLPVLFMVFQFMTQIGTCAESVGINATFTYGEGGSPRPNEFLPGELSAIALKFTGMNVSPEGDLQSPLQIELLNERQQSVNTVVHTEQTARLIFGGDSMRAPAAFQIPGSLPSGQYTLRLSTINSKNKTKAQKLLPIKVLSPDTFGIGNVRLARDRNGLISGGSCFNVGEIAYVNFYIQGAGILEDQWKLAIRVKVLNTNKEPISDRVEPLDLEISPPTDGKLPITMGSFLSAEGNYILKLEVEDLVTKKTIQKLLPVTVVDGLKDF